MSQLTLQSKLKLSDGNEIPILGFGTYELDGNDAYNAVKWALEAGYRHIDSAEWYENERECGHAILDFCKETDTPRSAIFYTTKLKSNSGYAATKRAIERSLIACGLGYIDLYLMHSPIGGPQARREAWKAICEAQGEGKLKSAGVSCFSVRHLKEMAEGGVPIPAVNQIDLHPFMTRRDIVTYCEEHAIALEAWAPLVRGLRFGHPDIARLATKYGKQPAHVLLRWSIQKGFIVIPKSASKSRIIANTQIFDFRLSDEDIALLDSLDEYLVTDWDPTDTP
ncbi:aldo-keto reductase [Gloeophyllum trabeum ATCC 11539]|uniref:Aldo-keto reductase n=1 Tax=Gloeophyllum trabeum (strain ATCC 11539 / FP-39264 / Madison 617) TaxID=670483 RepID=S7RI79_GLOTA|nr:aldo-keto reductase [Gloeophyllum trabeum ATCC 11539]EPQ53975.1 aldo-keto reductase [Gloeophyllum trabeum ATCC 11539]